MAYVDVRTSATRGKRGHLLFRFDTERDIIWIRQRGKDHFIDLKQIREQQEPVEN